MEQVRSYKDLIVWQKAMIVVKEIYQLADRLPKEERYGLSSQMKRCAVSIASNIAEGRRRGTKRDFVRFLQIAYGSGAELETQLEIVRMLSLISTEEVQEVESVLDEVMKMLNAMMRKLQATS